MTIKYKLLDNGTGLLKTRGAVASQIGEAEFLFDVEELGEMTAFFRNGRGEEIYRAIERGRCSVPTAKLFGIVGVTVHRRTGEGMKRWRCDKLRFEEHGDVTIAFPDENALFETVDELRVENERLGRETRLLREGLAALSERLTQIMEGYNVT